MIAEGEFERALLFTGSSVKRVIYRGDNVKKRTCLWSLLLVPLMLGVVCFTEINGVRLANIWMKISETPQYQVETHVSEGDSWNFGFGRRQIITDPNSTQPLYIAGYNNGLEGVLLIGIDCVALDSSTVQKIRNALIDLSNCATINVYATHTHAGVDTLGMWGPVGVDGKNDAYMENLIQAAEDAGREAVANRTAEVLYFGQVKTEEIMPYLDLTMDYKGENHYEETNSIGLRCASVILDTFETVLKEIGK